MTQKIPTHITITRTAYLDIQKSVKKAANRYEVGGVLIGQKYGCTHHIEAVTVDDHNNNATMTSFVLNGKVHTQLAKKYIISADKPLTLLGVWHSHICDTAKFSQQDRHANSTLASILDGAVSILVTWQDPASGIDIFGFYIAPDSSEHPQHLTIR